MSKKDKIAGGIILAGGAYLAYALFKKKKVMDKIDLTEVVELDEYQRQVTIISEENINAIAKQVSSASINEVESLKRELNAQFINLDETHKEIDYFKREIERLNAEIAAIDYRSYDACIDAAYNTLVQKIKAVHTAYDRYIPAKQNSDFYHNQLAKASVILSEVPWWDFVGRAIRQSEYDAAQCNYDNAASQAQALYNTYMNAEQAKKQAEALLNQYKENKATFYNDVALPLEKELSADKSNLNIWEIAYQSVQNGIKLLENKISELSK